MKPKLPKRCPRHQAWQITPKWRPAPAFIAGQCIPPKAVVYDECLEKRVDGSVKLSIFDEPTDSLHSYRELLAFLLHSYTKNLPWFLSSLVRNLDLEKPRPSSSGWKKATEVESQIMQSWQAFCDLLAHMVRSSAQSSGSLSSAPNWRKTRVEIARWNRLYLFQVCTGHLGR